MIFKVFLFVFIYSHSITIIFPYMYNQQSPLLLVKSQFSNSFPIRSPSNHHFSIVSGGYISQSHVTGKLSGQNPTHTVEVHWALQRTDVPSGHVTSHSHGFRRLIDQLPTFTIIRSFLYFLPWVVYIRRKLYQLICAYI